MNESIITRSSKANVVVLALDVLYFSQELELYQYYLFKNILQIQPLDPLEWYQAISQLSPTELSNDHAFLDSTLSLFHALQSANERFSEPAWWTLVLMTPHVPHFSSSQPHMDFLKKLDLVGIRIHIVVLDFTIPISVLDHPQLDPLPHSFSSSYDLSEEGILLINEDAMIMDDEQHHATTLIQDLNHFIESNLLHTRLLIFKDSFETRMYAFFKHLCHQLRQSSNHTHLDNVRVLQISEKIKLNCKVEEMFIPSGCSGKDITFDIALKHPSSALRKHQFNLHGIDEAKITSKFNDENEDRIETVHRTKTIDFSDLLTKGLALLITPTVIKYSSLEQGTRNNDLFVALCKELRQRHEILVVRTTTLLAPHFPPIPPSDIYYYYMIGPSSDEHVCLKLYAKALITNDEVVEALMVDREKLFMTNVLESNLIHDALDSISLSPFNPLNLDSGYHHHVSSLIQNAIRQKKTKVSKASGRLFASAEGYTTSMSKKPKLKSNPPSKSRGTRNSQLHKELCEE